MQTNIGEKFLHLIVAGHNFQVQKERQEVENPRCNCSGRMGPCPLGGGCLVDKVVYRATVVQDNSKLDTYTGLTSNSFKDRFYGHRNIFENRDQPKPTTLSTHLGFERK